MSLNQNQFKKSVVPGQIDLKSGGLDACFTVRIDPDSSAEDIIAGEGLRLVDGGANDPGGVPLVDVLNADTDKAFGARVFDTKLGKVQPGDICQVSSDGVVQWFEASEALNRGVKVALKLANPGQIQALGSNAELGTLLDKAAQGDYVRVLIKTVEAST